MRRVRLLRFVFVMIVLGQAGAARGQFESLLEMLPSEANTLVIFNLEAMLDSPLAMKEKWRENEDKMFQAGLVMVPPKTNQFVMASQLDIEMMQPHWTATLMNLSYEPTMIQVTEKFGGNVDEIGGQEAAVLPNNTYVVKFGKFLVGTMYPADRQKVTRWVQYAFSNSSLAPLGKYLAETEVYADKNKTPILIAIDLQHVFSEDLIRHHLTSAKSLAGKKVDLDQLAETLASIRGATLGINIDDRVYGGLKIDFDADVSALGDLAKPLVLECLGKHGVMIDEFNQWQAQTLGKEILLKGSLQQSGIQRICSLLDSPADLRPVQSPAVAATGGAAGAAGGTAGGTTGAPADPKAAAKADQAAVAQATLQYFKMMQQYLADIKTQRQEAQTSTPGLVAHWYERYASKIEALPTLHIDPEMVQFGVQVAQALRQAQGAMQGIGYKNASRFSNMTGAQVYDYQAAAGGRVGVGPYGGVGAEGAYAYRYSYNPWASKAQDGQQIAQMSEQDAIQGYGSANQTMEKVEEAMENMRRKMTAKYNMQF